MEYAMLAGALKVVLRKLEAKTAGDLPGVGCGIPLSSLQIDWRTICVLPCIGCGIVRPGLD